MARHDPPVTRQLVDRMFGMTRRPLGPNRSVKTGEPLSSVEVTP
jgi:hypothetical protein